MQIEVTTALIRAGHRNSNGHCPVGLAIRKATGKRMKMIGHALDDNTFVSLAGDEQIFYGPRELMQFVHDFDMGRPVEPFTFSLRNQFFPAE